VKVEVQVCKAPVTELAFNKVQMETVFVREAARIEAHGAASYNWQQLPKKDAFAWKLADIRTGKVSPIEEEISQETLGVRTRIVPAHRPTAQMTD